MVAPLLIPILTTLATKGLDLIGSAILAKGKDVVEKELGVSIEDELATPEGVSQLKELQFNHEERLLELALEDKKLDQTYYKIDADERANARAREVAVIEAEHAGWLNKNIVSIITLIIIIGGGAILAFHEDNEVKFSISNLLMLVLGFYYGTSKASGQKDIAINNLSARKE